jgi:ribose 5-phosphate isomerase B
MKIAIGCDHGGFPAKDPLVKHLKEEGHEVIEFGTNSTESCHYPEFAFKVAEAVASGQAEKGILICSSGEGMAICANKVKGIRCGIGYNYTVSDLIVEHNHCNMIAFGAKYMSTEDIIKRTDIFLEAVPASGRHQIRVDMITDYENKHTK